MGEGERGKVESIRKSFRANRVDSDKKKIIKITANYSVFILKKERNLIVFDKYLMNNRLNRKNQRNIVDSKLNSLQLQSFSTFSEVAPFSTYPSLKF